MFQGFPPQFGMNPNVKQEPGDPGSRMMGDPQMQGPPRMMGDPRMQADPRMMGDPRMQQMFQQQQMHPGMFPNPMIQQQQMMQQQQQGGGSPGRGRGRGGGRGGGGGGRGRGRGGGPDGATPTKRKNSDASPLPSPGKQVKIEGGMPHGGMPPFPGAANIKPEEMDEVCYFLGYVTLLILKCSEISMKLTPSGLENVFA